MYRRPFFSMPTWQEPFSTVPRYQLITFCTYQKEETLGKILHYQGQAYLEPTSWGMAATRASRPCSGTIRLPSSKSSRSCPITSTYSSFTKKFHPRLPEWFIEKSQGIPALLYRTALRPACPRLGGTRRDTDGLHGHGPVCRRRKLKRIRPPLEIRPTA